MAGRDSQGTHPGFSASVSLLSCPAQQTLRVAIASIVQLGDLLRRVLRAGQSDLATVQDELELVHLYLELQHMRFADRLALTTPASAMLPPVWVPSLILQPLVENAIQESPPQILLLDVQMTPITGIALARALEAASLPLIVFVTAYESFALDALELSAVDYVVKPFSDGRVHQALARANRFTDVYVLYQPYTFQDNSPTGQKSPTSWALGVTVPLPVYNRNQGGILRAKLNVTQTQIELATIERQVMGEVQIAEKEYEISRKAIERIEKELLPRAAQVRDDTKRLYLGGESNVVVFLNAQKDYNDTVKQYLDTSVRHRRSMLLLNTALGQRVLP
jgi:DNA-binding LytR/AlgR family response regulator